MGGDSGWRNWRKCSTDVPPAAGAGRVCFQREAALRVCIQLYENQRTIFTSSQAAVGQDGQAGSGTAFFRCGRACISKSPLTLLSSPSFKEISPPACLSALALLIQPLGLHPAALSSQYWFWRVVSRKFPSGLFFVSAF